MRAADGRAAGTVLGQRLPGSEGPRGDGGDGSGHRFPGAEGPRRGRFLTSVPGARRTPRTDADRTVPISLPPLQRKN